MSTVINIEAHKQALRDAAARAGARFCDECGTKVVNSDTCPECGQKVGAEDMAKQKAAGNGSKNSTRKTKKAVDTTETEVVGSTQAEETVSEQVAPEQTATATEQDAPAQSEGVTKMAELTFKGLSKNGRAAIYSGAGRGTIRIALGSFADKQAPQTIEIGDVFTKPAAKMTAEERKAARANKPKPTLAEKIAKREAALEKLRAKLVAEGTPEQQAATEAAAAVGSESM